MTACKSCRAWAATVVVAACLGCRVGPDYRQPSAPVAPAWTKPAQQTPAATVGDLQQWWRDFHDPQLDALVSAAVEQNLPLREAYLRVVEARARRGVARGELFPDASHIGSYTHNRISPNGNPFGSSPNSFGPFNLFSYGFDAAWELDFWGKYRRLVESATAEVDVAVEDYRGVLLTLLGDVGTNYVEIRAFDERTAVALANRQVQERTLMIAQARYKAGLVGELDVAQATASLRQIESTLPTLQIERQQAVYRLCILLGIPPQEIELSGECRIPAAAAEIDLGVPADLLRRRPDVRRAEREVAARNARIGVAEADYYPQVSLTGTITAESRELSKLFASASLAHAMGPGFTWNVLNFGRIRNNARLKVAERDESVIAYRQQVLKAAEEVESALVAYVEEQRRRDSLSAAVTAGELALRLAEAKYQEGLTDFVRVLEAQRMLFALQEQLVGSRAAISLQRIALYKALGGGWQAGSAAIGAPPSGVEVTPLGTPPETLPPSSVREGDQASATR